MHMRTTVTINDKLFQVVKLRAAETNGTLSQIVEEALTYQMLEDMEDIEDAMARQNEPTYSFDELVGEFRAEGLL